MNIPLLSIIVSFCLVLVFASPSSVTTVDQCSCCEEMFYEHLMSQEGVLEASHLSERGLLEVFVSAVHFASDPNTSSFPLESLNTASFPLLHLLLNYFLKTLPLDVTRSIEFLRAYSDNLAPLIRNSHDTIKSHQVAAVVCSLASTGSFLLYSRLFNENFHRFSLDEVDSIFLAHCQQSRSVFRIEQVKYEATILGIQYLCLRIHRLEILSIFSVEDQITLKIDNPAIYYYLAFFPIHEMLKIPLESLLVWEQQSYEAISKASESFDLPVLFQLDQYLETIKFIFYQSQEEFQHRRFIFSVYIKNCPFGVLDWIDAGLLTIFVCYCRFTFDEMNSSDEKLEAIKVACYISSNPAFRLAYDSLLSHYEVELTEEDLATL